MRTYVSPLKVFLITLWNKSVDKRTVLWMNLNLYEFFSSMILTFKLRVAKGEVIKIRLMH